MPAYFLGAAFSVRVGLGAREFWPDTTDFPVWLSSCLRACLAMPPPALAALVLSARPVASAVSAIWRVGLIGVRLIGVRI